MSNESIKGYVAMMIAFAFAIAAVEIFTKNGEDPAVKIEAIKAGLEQCPMSDRINSKTIWVKNCKEYMKERE
jgi:hypothetical protein